MAPSSAALRPARDSARNSATAPSHPTDVVTCMVSANLRTRGVIIICVTRLRHVERTAFDYTTRRLTRALCSAVRTRSGLGTPLADGAPIYWRHGRRHRRVLAGRGPAG